jgi:hypothetical protein
MSKVEVQVLMPTLTKLKALGSLGGTFLSVLLFLQSSVASLWPPLEVQKVNLPK